MRRIVSVRRGSRIELDHTECAEVTEYLKSLPDEVVQTVITSPPYWGLRDYGTPGQLGLEPTPKEYLEKMVGIFREVRRVLRGDGTVWLNMGDCYASQGERKHGGFDGRHYSGLDGARIKDQAIKGESLGAPMDLIRGGLKPKDLCGMPWRLALALQADGWWLRSDIIWAKPNPIPEPCTDRPTKAHEYLFLLTKSAKYFYDADAVKEPHTQAIKDGVTPVAEWRPQRESKGKVQQADKPFLNMRGGTVNRNPGYYGNPAGRNKRTVWTIATQPYPEAHFATFPEALIEPCILAGTSEKGCCPECGSPWERVVDYTPNYTKREPAHAPRSEPSKVDSTGWEPPTIKQLGFQPTCSHNLEPEPCIVLDPFMGSGTTALVALKHRRHFIGCDINPEYVELANKRMSEVQVKLL